MPYPEQFHCIILTIDILIFEISDHFQKYLKQENSQTGQENQCLYLLRDMLDNQVGVLKGRLVFSLWYVLVCNVAVCTLCNNLKIIYKTSLMELILFWFCRRTVFNQVDNVMLQP